MRETWGCIAARALTDPISYFLFFWIPLYLQKERDFSLAAVGTFVWIPYVAWPWETSAAARSRAS